MIKLLKNCSVYAPARLGKKDILIANDRICWVDDSITGFEGLPGVEVFDVRGNSVVPGYIDLHSHIIGGGGEQGPASKVPEAQLSQLLRNGITTVVGVLGIDGITRSNENLVSKARALTEEGMTAYTLVSAYTYPPTAITGSVEKDIAMIPPMIGVKAAVVDHRSSNPTGEELIRLATAARRGGMLGGVPGLVNIHVGTGSAGLDPVFFLFDHSDVPKKNILPTHLNRPGLFEQAQKLVRCGGYADFTAGQTEATRKDGAEMLLHCLRDKDLNPDHFTLSSDSFGSMPRFNEKGDCVGMTYATPDSLHKTVQTLVELGCPLEEAVKPLTSSPADILLKTGVKGCIQAGADADLLILDDGLEIDGLFVRGQTAMWNRELRMRGRFEQAE